MSLLEGLLGVVERGEGRSYAFFFFFFLFSSQSVQFHHLHRLVSIRGLVDSKPGHYPESAQSEEQRGVLAENASAVLPLFGQFRGFPLLLRVVGWGFLVWIFFFFKVSLT